MWFARKHTDYQNKSFDKFMVKAHPDLIKFLRNMCEKHHCKGEIVTENIFIMLATLIYKTEGKRRFENIVTAIKMGLR